MPYYKKFDLVELDGRHKGSKYFKYRLEFRFRQNEPQTEAAIVRFARMQFWFTQQFGLGYDFNTWSSLAWLKSELLNPYWCFDTADDARCIYMWNDDMLTLLNLYHAE